MSILEQSIDMAKKMGLTISETDILATTSKGIVVSNTDILNHLASLKNKTQTREQKYWHVKYTINNNQNSV